MTMQPSPTSVASQPTTNRPGADRPSIVNVEVPSRAGGAPASSASPASSGPDRRAGPAGSTLGQGILRGARQRPGRRTGRALAAHGRRQRGRGGRRSTAGPPDRTAAARGHDDGGAAVAGAAGASIRPVGSEPRGRAPMAAGASRRSKSLPHQAHSDQSMPTSRLQFGQTRFRRVRQLGQMIHSSSIRRSQPGQWWIDSTSARSASSARFRSQTSPIFSCGRTIL